MENNQFTLEGFQLATFKMAVENNAMLHSIINVLSRMYAQMPMSPDAANPKLEDAIEELRQKFESNTLDMARVLEQISIKNAHDFATEHDSNLDIDFD